MPRRDEREIEQPVTEKKFFIGTQKKKKVEAGAGGGKRGGGKTVLVNKHNLRTGKKSLPGGRPGSTKTQKGQKDANRSSGKNRRTR